LLPLCYQAECIGQNIQDRTQPSLFVSACLTAGRLALT